MEKKTPRYVIDKYGRMIPDIKDLDEIIEIIHKRFPEEIEYDFTADVIFKKQYSMLFKFLDYRPDIMRYPEYCFLEFNEGDWFDVTLFFSDGYSWKEIERDCLNYGMSFLISSKSDLEKIINSRLFIYRDM